VAARDSKPEKLSEIFPRELPNMLKLSVMTIYQFNTQDKIDASI